MSARLDAVLPGPRRTLFLRACLLDREAAQAAWQEWLAGADDPVAAFADPRQACRRLAPLLTGVATGRAGGRLGAAVAASAVREELRWQTLSAAAAQTLDVLGAVGVDAVVTGGVAAAVTVYADPWQRHCHDVDVVVGTNESRAATAMSRAGLHRARALRAYVHPSGTLLALHAAALRSRWHTLRFEEVHARAVPAPLGDGHEVMMTREHLLLRACEGAFVHGGPGSPLVWAADAALIARSLDAGGWAGVVDSASRSRMTTPVAVCLGFLADQVGIPIPSEPLAELRERAVHDGPGAKRACLALVPPGSRTRWALRRVRRRLVRAPRAGSS
jgi:hypothetical protein